MGKINVLSFAVANLIAAGEVVDRPASVIKELTENAIDSGADSITIEIQNGGVTLMRVSDNGCGISKDDLPIAVRRHATSKIKDEGDLAAIMTLGFRGEALAAIAAVSDLRIISKPRDQENGASIEVSGGVVIGVHDRAARDGTTVMVENLFANVPARRKFLKKDITETMAVTAVIERIALSHPEISFKLICDGTTKLETVGDGKLKSAIYAVFGRDFTKALLEVSGGVEGIRVTGFCGTPQNCKANRNFQNFFINGRYVKSRTAQAAIEQAYVSYIASERFPVCALNIEIDPSQVDVNVHPSKLEVKFSNEKPVFEAVYYSVRSALEQNVTRPEMKLPVGDGVQITESVKPVLPRMSDRTEPIRDEREEGLARRQLAVDVTAPEIYAGNVTAFKKLEEKVSEVKKEKVTEKTVPIAPVKESSFARDLTAPVSVSEKKEEKTEFVPPYEAEQPSFTEPKREIPEAPIIRSFDETRSYRIIGEAFNSYVIVERGEKIILIDKHAAHERIIFERLRANMKDRKIPSQILLMPMTVMLRSDEIACLEEYRREIESVGFGFKAGRHVVEILEVPEGIDVGDSPDILSEFADKLLNATGTVDVTRDAIFEKALYQASCKAAIKAGREYSKENIEALVAELMSIEDITVCPHGRPVAMELSKKNIDRQFART